MLKQIEGRMLKMADRTYASTFRGRILDLSMDFVSPQYSDVSDTVKCRACGIGAAWLSLVRFENECTVQEIEGKDGVVIRKLLKGVFSIPQLDLIESAYEQRAMFQFRGRTLLGEEADFIGIVCQASRGNPFAANATIKFSNLPKAKQNAIDAAVKFGKAFSRNEERAVAIFQNIVDHEGTFSPEVEYEISEVTA